MALVNALLVRYVRGQAWVTDAASIAAYGRREGYLELGAVNSLAEVNRVGAAVLALKAQPQIATRATLEPAGADTPYDSFEVADSITVPDESGAGASMRVMALSVTEDDMGNPTFVPELRSLADEADRRLQRWLKRMANGTLAGSVESATPAAPQSDAGDPPKEGGTLEAPPFSLASLALSTSDRYYPPTATRVIRLVASLKTAGSSPTSLYLLKNGAQTQGLTIPASDNIEAVDCSVPYSGPEQDYMQVQVTAVGTGAAGLTVQPRLG